MEHELSELLALPTPVVSAVLSKLGYVADVEEDSEVGQFVARLQTKLRAQQASEDNSNGDDAESQKAQLQYENTRLENEVHRLNKQLGQVKSALDSSANETRSAQAELQATKALLDSAKAEVQEQQAQSSSHSAAESQLRGQVSQLRDEKRQLLEQLGERRDQLDARATECQRAQESLSELRQQRARDQEELARLRSQTSVSDVSEHMLRQSLDLAKSQVAWLDEELGRTQTELQQAKADLARATTAGRADAARLRADTEDDHATDRDDDEQWLSDVDRVISQRLVTFADIVELVAQNQRLLRTTRELAAQVAHEEQVRRAESEDEVKQALEQAETMLDRLTIELESTKSRMGVISRERDMLKTMKSDEPEKTQTPPPRPPPSSSYSSLPVAAKAEVAESSSSEDPLAKLQADYDLYRSETRKTRVLLERDAGTLQQEVSDLRVRAAKAEAQTQFDAERIQLFASDLSARQKEIDHLRMATSRLHAQVESYERQLDAQSQSQAAERAELSALRRASTLLEAERDSLQHNEQRWRKEEQRLVAERASLTQILENTTRMRDEWQRAADDQVVQVKDRLEAARKDADEARAELRVSRDALDRAQFRADAEVQELRATVQARDERVALLQAQLVEAKDRIAS
ncbi:Filament-forming protein, partial [Coemansia sp. RSA 25]